MVKVFLNYCFLHNAPATTSPFSTTLKRKEITHDYSRQLPDQVTIIFRYINDDFKNGVPLSFLRLPKIGLF
jgi:hypothetical protein